MVGSARVSEFGCDVWNVVSRFCIYIGVNMRLTRQLTVLFALLYIASTVYGVDSNSKRSNSRFELCKTGKANLPIREKFPTCK